MHSASSIIVIHRDSVDTTPTLVFLRLIVDTIRGCHSKGRWVTYCRRMAVSFTYLQIEYLARARFQSSTSCDLRNRLTNQSKFSCCYLQVNEAFVLSAQVPEKNVIHTTLKHITILSSCLHSIYFACYHMLNFVKNHL